MTKADPQTCRICGRHYANHTPCEVCRSPLEHRDLHPDGKTTDEEWEGHARMAKAGADAGRPLSVSELKALKRYMQPARLTIDGYRRPNGAVPPWGRV